MKNLFLLLLIHICLDGTAQIPTLQLRNPISGDLELPESLMDNEICLIYQKTHGWSAYDTNHYYYTRCAF